MNIENNRKIKILRIIGECKVGGTETIALNYYHHLNHNRISMDFLFYGESLPHFDAALMENGDKVINVVDYTKDLFGSILEIKKVVEEGGYDIVHSQMNALNVFPLVGAWLGGAQIRVCANHSTANLKYEFKKSIVKYLLRPTTKIFATHYAACSRFAGEWCFGKKYIERGKVKIIRNAISLDAFTFKNVIRNDVRRNEQWEDKFVIGHAGRFTEQKNHEFLVRIFSKIHKKNPNTLLVLVGEGHLKKKIIEYVEELRLTDAVQFLGIRFDVNRLMQGMDVFVFPSLYEGLGNVIIEAQAAGLHSVISDAVPDEVKMSNLVDFVSLSDDISVWESTISKYYDGYVHSGIHEVLIENGYEISSAAKDLENYYSRISDEKLIS